MNCAQGSQWISRWLDGELPASEQAALRDHLARCPVCRKLEREQRRLHEAIKAMPSPALPPDHAQRLRQTVWQKVRASDTVRVSLPFRIMAIAALLLLSVAVVLLAWRLHERQREVERLRTAVEATRRGTGGTVGLPGFPLVRSAAAEDINEQVLAFASVQDYLGGAMRWMAVEGNQVEIGVSGAGVNKAAERSAARQVVIVRLQYVELRRDGKTQTLSNPQFVLLPGEEASVRLARKDGGAGDLFRYRVEAAKEKAGQIRAHISFARESASEDSQGRGPDSPITTDVLAQEGAPVLVGASGDASCRRELYMWAVTRPARVTGRNGSGEGKHL